MINPKRIDNKQIVLLLLVSQLMLVILLLMPDWWTEVERAELVGIYPHFGKILYFLVHHLQFIYLIVSSFLCIVLIFRSEKIKQIAKYANHNVFDERNFVSSLFLRFLSFVYFIAFSSVLWQFSLISEEGLIPFKEFALLTFKYEGMSSWFSYPSIFWISQSDIFIKMILILCILVSIYSLISKSYLLNYLILWFGYLSIVTFGREIFHFPWDTLLLEAGILSVLLTIFLRKKYLPRILIFAFLLLFFRQWFSMAITKVSFGDPTWYDLTYMKYFWLNQPSPTPIAVYLYNLPMWFHKFATFVSIILELAIPLAMFFGRRGRILAFFTSAFLSVLIQLAGNFGFFNILTIVLGLWCLDDRFFKKVKAIQPGLIIDSPKLKLISRVSIYMIVFFNLFYISLFFFDRKTQKHPLNYTNYYFVEANRPSAGNDLGNCFFSLGRVISVWRIVSPHGVFKYIPKRRLALQVEIKNNSKWAKVEFSKGTDVNNFSFSAPNMSRLPYHFFYQSLGIDFRNLLQVNTNRDKIPLLMENLISKMFQGNNEIKHLIQFPDHGSKKIQFIHGYLYAADQNKIMFKNFDTLVFQNNEKINSPLFKTREIFKKLRKKGVFLIKPAK